jgi:circadian clock protein KaiB
MNASPTCHPGVTPNPTTASPVQAAAGRYERWTLRLYVAGQTPRSLRAVANLERICAEQLQGRYRLEVIDLYQQPQLAQGEQIVAVPALIRHLPEPLRMVIGDMSDSERVLIGLDLLPK